MFAWPENRKKQFASATLMLFLASWLMFICQTCFASFHEAEPVIHQAESTNTSCHTADNYRHDQTVKLIADDHPCLGACDCNEISASLNSATHSLTKTEKQAEKDYYFPAAITSFPSVVNFQKASTQRHPIPLLPDRAIFLPHQYYVVLLI